MKDLVLNEEFLAGDTHIYKSFHDVATVEEFWQFMRGPMVGNLFPDDCYNAQMPRAPMNRSSCAGIINMNNLLVRGIRLRQFRMKQKTGEAGSECSGDLESSMFWNGDENRVRAVGDACFQEEENALKTEKLERDWRDSNHSLVDVDAMLRGSGGGGGKGGGGLVDPKTRECFNYKEVNDTGFTGTFGTDSGDYFFTTGGQQVSVIASSTTPTQHNPPHHIDCLAPHHDDSSNTCGKYLASNVFAHSRAFALLLVSAFTFPSSLLPFSIPTYSAI